MRWIAVCAVAATLVVPTIGLAQEGESKVTMSLEKWERMVTLIEMEEKSQPPVVPVARMERHIEGVFAKGLFSGTLVERFQVLDTNGHVRVPVIDGEVSLGEVSLDGERTSLLKEADMYTLGVDQPGTYEVRLKFYWGEDQNRFARKLHFNLPEGGITSFSVTVPETEIDARLNAGAFTLEETRGAGTLLEGNLDSTGVFDLAWTRRVTHKGDQAARMEARVSTLFTVEEALTSGKTVIDYSMIEGETDVIHLDLPEGIEVVKVDGDAVLQWRTDAGSKGSLTVLLRYLVADNLSVTVHFQAPSESGKPVPLSMPLPPAEVPINGAAGVQGPSGLKIGVSSVEKASKLTAYELPPQLADLTSKPILFGFGFTEPPVLAVTVSRHSQVTLTSTLVEEMQASTVIAEDGTEVTKAKIRIRNNTREYLVIKLPKGAVLTHSLVDGQPIRPALSDPGDHQTLLFPLRQSERITAGGARIHTVREGETLSDIANFYYSDPTRWSAILSENGDTLYSAAAVSSGQELRIPTLQGVSVEESTFIIELAYKAKRDPLGLMGNRGVSLPSLDVDTMRVTWHLYLPGALDPLEFEANLTQHSAIRYDLFRRIREFIDQALWIDYAWAGGKYENILSKRKAIYRKESTGKDMGRAIRAAFPLVGQQYRFKRILLGKETPSLSFTYIDRTVATVIRWVAMGGAFLLTLLLLARIRKIHMWIITVAGLVALVFAAHYFLGTHRRIVWGIDLALIVALLRLRAGPLWEHVREILKSPWMVVEMVNFRNLAFLIGLCTAISFVLLYPLFVSSTALVVLAFLWWLGNRKSGKEAANA